MGLGGGGGMGDSAHECHHCSRLIIHGMMKKVEGMMMTI